MLFHIKNPFIFTIFGASGDLAKLKIFPTMYELMAQRRFPEEFYIVGYARTPMSRKAFRDIVKTSVEEKFGEHTNTKILNKLLRHVWTNAC